MDDVLFQEGILLTEQWLEKQFGWKVELNYLRCLAGSPMGRSKKIVVVPPKPRVGLCRFAR